MARQGQQTTLAERVEVWERSTAGQSDPEIAGATGLSVWTVRKWRRKARREGRAGLASWLGRPASGALGQFPAGVREAIRHMRKAHPGWGPGAIHAELKRDTYWGSKRLPSRSRIAAFLKQEGLVRRYERHAELPQPKPGAPRQAHEAWEMDAKGVIQVPHLGRVSLINIGDVFSRLTVACYPCIGTSKPSTPDYQIALRWAFLRRGLPRRLDLDHDHVFYDNTTPSPFPTRLHLWLIALGIEVRFGRKGHPTDHGFIERMHQSTLQQAILGQTVGEALTLLATSDDRLDFLNTNLPCRSLGGRPPLVAHPEAGHSGRPYRPEWEEEMLNLDRLSAYLAQGRWFRRTSDKGQFSLGDYRYGVGKDWGSQTLEITFDPTHVAFVCRAEDGQQTTCLPAQGLTKADLMHELKPWLTLPVYQLALPFSPAAWRETLLCHIVTGTTL